MPTIGNKKKTKSTKQVHLKKFPKSKKLPKLPKSGFKRVAKSVLGDGYDLSNKDILKRYFNKDGTLKRSALRSKKQVERFKQEVAKAKEEIKQQQQAKKEEREQKRKERKKKQKRKKQKQTYKERGHEYSESAYDTFIDILESVYDEVALLFYDSDQIMQMIESNEYTFDDIVQLLKDINKSKEDSLTKTEKKLLEKGKFHLDKEEKEMITKDVSESIYVSSKTDLTPQALYMMKQNEPFQYQQLLMDVLTDDEIEKILNG